MDGIEDNFEANKNQENAVGKARQGVYLPQTVREALGRRPPCHDRRREANRKTGTVKEHVDAVCQKPKRSSQEAVGKLHDHKAKI